MKKISILLLLINFIFCTGKYGDAFLNLGASARDVGVGQAVVSDLSNASGYNVCPAAIAGLDKKTFYLLLINQYGLAEYFSGGAVLPLKRNYFVGVNTTGLIVDNILIRPDLSSIGSLETRRDSIRSLMESGFESFDDTEFAATITFAKMNKSNFRMGMDIIPYQLPVGFNIRLIRKKLYELEASGIGFDVGGILSFELSELFSNKWLGRFSIGTSFNHVFNTHLFWNSDRRDIIPMQMVRGMTYDQPLDKIHSQLSIMGQQNNLYPDEVQYGLELITLNRLFIRIGNRSGTNQGGLGILANVHKMLIRIDYSFANHDLGNAHRLGFQLEF